MGLQDADTVTNDAIGSQTSSDAGDSQPEQCSLQAEVDSRLPSVGSAEHSIGLCSPCGFVHHTKGCAAGADCKFCHLCPPGTIEQKRKMKRKMVRSALQAQQTKGMPPLLVAPR